jgi:hypothetical protein
VLDREEVDDDELDAQEAADDDMEAFIEGDEEEEEEEEVRTFFHYLGVQPGLVLLVSVVWAYGKGCCFAKLFNWRRGGFDYRRTGKEGGWLLRG